MSFFVLFWDDAYEVQVIDNCFNRKYFIELSAALNFILAFLVLEF